MGTGNYLGEITCHRQASHIFRQLFQRMNLEINTGLLNWPTWPPGTELTLLSPKSLPSPRKETSQTLLEPSPLSNQPVDRGACPFPPCEQGDQKI